MPPIALMQSPPGPDTVIDGVRYLYFAGTSYLGLAAHPEVIEAGCEAMRCYGVHSATTRARFGTNPPVLEVERRAAEFFGTEDAFYFGSGYVANHIMVAALAPKVRLLSRKPPTPVPPFIRLKSAAAFFAVLLTAITQAADLDSIAGAGFACE